MKLCKQGRIERIEMKKQNNIILGIVLLLVSFLYIVVRGSVYTIAFDVSRDLQPLEAYQIQIDQDKELVRITDTRLEEKTKTLYVTLQAVSRGKVFVEVETDEIDIFKRIYVHRLGIITEEDYFGKATGSRILPICITIWLVFAFVGLIRQYRKDVKENLYQYKTIRDLALVFYTASLLIGQIPYLLSNDGIVRTVASTLNAASVFAFFAFPIAFVVSILVTISNIQLLRKEGKTWRNLLGCFLGLLICIGTVFPYGLGEVLQRVTFVDVHNEQGIALYVETLVENGILVVVTYLECILLSTILLATKAAKRIPTFDRDYILILGCKIKSDGTLTNLLKGRADRALAFARMQKEATGKDLVFVPSGGKGADEVMAEAEAIRNYLLQSGIPEEQILTENQSVNTYENFQNAMALIRTNTTLPNPKLAFATTNYHVFRSGILAAKQGIRAEGIGSGTRSYFWINAFIREFTATVYAERKVHIWIVAGMEVCVLILIGILYFSVQM